MMNSCPVICFVVFLVYSTLASSLFPVELSLSEDKRYFPHVISTYTQYVNVQIKTGARVDTQTQLPRELFIILDSSGSMAGANKWRNAISAIEHIIQNMNIDDKLHLIQYNSVSSVVFENANDQQVMLKSLRALNPSGGTNLMAGFDQVIPLLKKYSDRSTVKRLFILSDGQINEGVTDHEHLLREVTFIKKTYDVTICSFGIGYDFDEQLMTNIADHGSGDYFFIQGAESMEKVIGIAYRGFQNLMGTNAFLKVTTKYESQIVGIFGYEMNPDEEQIIPIGHLRYNDMMNVLLETNVKITEELLEQSDIDYMIVELWMIDITDRSLKLIDTQIVRFSLSRNDEELKESNEIVQSLVETEKIQRQESEVTRLLRERRVDEAIAMKQSIHTRLTQASSALDSSAIKNEADQVAYEYTQGKFKSMIRRSIDMMDGLVSGPQNSKHLAMGSAYSAKLNQKHSSATEDL